MRRTGATSTGLPVLGLPMLGLPVLGLPVLGLPVLCLLVLGLLVLGPLTCAGAHAASPPRAAILASLCGEGTRAVLGGLGETLAATPDESASEARWAQRVLQAFSGHALQCAPGDQAFLSDGDRTLDAVTLQPARAPDDSHAPLPSLRARVALAQTQAALALVAARDPAERLAAARTLADHAGGLPPGLPAAALAREHDPRVAAALRVLVAEAGLHAPQVGLRLAAIAALRQDASSATAQRLAALRADTAYVRDPRIATALDRALAHVRFWLRVGDGLALLYNGVSAGSVLFMSAVGLAIIFGLMGVINLAQGEFIMLGAYVTYCVQEALRLVAPAWLDWYPLLAIPVVFTVTGAAGMVIERVVICHLYRRPLMTLLATWAISLLLTNLVRVIFGTQNLRFQTPWYLTGGVRVVGDFLITTNHLFAIAFAVAAFVASLALLRLTPLGLFIRATTQNRGMAGCVGIATRRIDMAAFGFGAGLAGLAGLALSPIYNVNPTMGTGFIIDSFMVVVLGGVGSLLGTALAALGIGLVDVGIEPFYGAVAAKVIALLLIIVLIQWRPQGLIAARGRR